MVQFDTKTPFFQKRQDCACRSCLDGNMKKYGFFGGTFDPIHFGHLNLAIQLKELCALDRVLVCPAMLSPTQPTKFPKASIEHRLAMTRLAIEDIPGFSLLDHEALRASPSYTIDTLQALISGQQNHVVYRLLLAEDTACSLEKWKDVKTLLDLAPPLVGRRYHVIPKELEHLPEFIRIKLQKGYCHIPIMEISSTLIRERIKKTFYCQHLLPRKVLDYIYAHRLYYAC